MGRISGVFACLFVNLGMLSWAIVCQAQFAPQSRITEPLDASQMTALRGNVSPLARPDFDRGRVSGAMPMSVTLSFSPSASQQAALDQLLAEQQDPDSPNYHKWLTHEQFGARFGMSAADLAKVTAWLKSQGLTVGNISRSRNSLSFSGTTAQVERALHTEIHDYMVNGEMHFANATEPQVPSALAGVVLGFMHLNNFQPKPRGRVRTIPASEVTSHFTSSQSGSHFLSPDDFATIYNLQPLYSAGFDGTGVSIAVIGQTAINTADIDAFRSAAGLPARTSSNFQLTLVPGTGASTSCTGDLGEADLDVEWSAGVAKGATLQYVYAGVGSSGRNCNNRNANVWNALQYAVQTMTPAAPVISISYGFCESGLGLAFSNQVRGWAQQAVAQGQTITAASGDAGAADCDSAPTATQGLQVDIPAAVPEIVAVGGTEFTGDAGSTSTTQYWTGASGSDTISSAITYIPETSWNDTPQDNTGSNPQFAGTGGGASTFFNKPSWQTGTGVPAANHRYVPDVSLAASADHDGYLVCTQGSCVNGFRLANGNLSVFGGTSASSQVMGGVLAVLNQATHSSGLGNANMELYTLASTTPLAFHDITSGNNFIPCSSGPTDCPASTPFQIGFSAGANYDEVTGLGTLNVDQLAVAWPGFSATKAASTTTVTASASSIPAGTIVTFTATVAASGGSGPARTGTVQFAVDGVNDGSQVTLAGGTASHTNGSLTVGTHTITAVYSGDSNYLGSTSANFTETVTNTFDLAADPTSTTASPGGAPTSTITVSSPVSNNFSGTVSLTCTPSSTTAQVTCSLSPASVVLNGSTTSATSTLTIHTVAASAIGTTSADARPHGRLGWLAGSSGILFAGVVLLGVPARKRRWLAMAAMAVLVSVAMGVGCGGGSNSSGGGSSSNAGTPKGDYTVTVTGTSGSTSHQTQVTLTVQ